MRLTAHHRLPRAGIDPIDSHELGLLSVTMAMTLPPRHETIVVLLDDSRRGISIVVVSDTTRPDAVLDVVECLMEPAAQHGRAAGAIVASVRPGGVADRADIDRWLELSDIAEQEGVELVEWYVLGAEVTCPRDLLGETPRW